MPFTSPSSTTVSDYRRPTRFRHLAGLAGLLVVLISSDVESQTETGLRFTDIATESGVKFSHNFGADQLEHVLMTTGSGCALFDYDGDGWLDAFLVNGTFLDEHGRRRRDKITRHGLFRNRGDGTFEKVTRQAGFVEPTYGQGVTCGDYDGDGHVDLYLTNYGANKLYRNRGDGTFEDVTERSGTGDTRWSTGAVFFDYDGDGDLDLFVANYVQFQPDSKAHASALSKRTGFRFFPGPRDYEAEEDVLYRNDGDGTFTDVGREVGLASGGKGLNAVAADFDDDGDPDLFVANDATPNFFYRNDGGKLVEIALQSRTAYDPDGVETAAMGVDIADLDGDARLDLYVTNMVFEFNNLYRNRGDLVFDDVTRAFGLDEDNYRHVGWATRFEDFDLDGNLDCFVANGHVVDYVEGFSQSITYGQQNMLFLGDGRGRFENVANQVGECFGNKRVSRGAAFGDIDNDGDIDLLISNSGGRAELLRNDLPPTDRWLKLRLRGPAPNVFAIGARVTVFLAQRRHTTEVRFSSSYLSSSDPTIHLGLGAEDSEGRLEVRWPSGQRSEHRWQKAKVITIEAPEPQSEDRSAQDR